QQPKSRQIVGLVGDPIERIADSKALHLRRSAEGDSRVNVALDYGLLLNGMRQLVGDQFSSALAVGLELVLSKENMLPDRECVSIEVCALERGGFAGVNADVAKIRTEPGLHVRANRGRQRRAARNMHA